MPIEADYGLVMRLIALRDLLRRGPYSKAEICRWLPRYYQPGPAGSRRLGRDVRALRQLGYSVHVERSAQTYSLDDAPHLVLNNEEVQTLALIRESFAALPPKSGEVLAVLERIVTALPESQRHLYYRRSPIAIRLHPAVDYRPFAKTIRSLEQAISQSSKVRLVYPALEDGTPAAHVGVEPYEIQFFDRHFYLIRLSPLASQIMEFRIDRVRGLELMPGRVGAKRKRPSVAFSYRLSPHIARLGVSERFLNQTLIPQTDGSVVVRAEGYSDFRIIQDLLRYGEHAELLSPRRLRYRMAQVVSAMVLHYEDEDPDK